MKEKHSLVFFEIAFIGLVLAAGILGKLPAIPGPLLVLLLGLASYRGGRALAFNLVFKPLRDLLGIVELPDSSGAGDNNHATGTGFKWAFGELISCPICSGTWVAVVLLLTYSLHPQAGTALIYALSASGIAELSHWLSESFQWNGRYARENAGLLNRKSKENVQTVQDPHS